MRMAVVAIIHSPRVGALSARFYRVLTSPDVKSDWRQFQGTAGQCWDDLLKLRGTFVRVWHSDRSESGDVYAYS